MNENDIHVLRRFKNGSTAIECAFCEGSGTPPKTADNDDSAVETVPCSVCNGVGFNIFNCDIENLITCHYCSKSGQGWDDSGYFLGEICEICLGKGVVIIDRPDILENNAFLWSLLHPTLSLVSKEKFDSGFFADAVESAYKEVNKIVKQIVKDIAGDEIDGANLMNRAFSVNDPVIKLNKLANESEKNEQKGFMQIFAGVMTGIRNPQAHDNLEIERSKAIHFLFLASLLLYKLDDRT